MNLAELYQRMDWLTIAILIIALMLGFIAIYLLIERIIFKGGQNENHKG